MARKKVLRSDKTYMIVSDCNPKLGAKILSDGRESLFLDYYLGCEKSISERTGKETTKAIRKREYLSLYLAHDARETTARQKNSDTLELAKAIMREREQQVLDTKKGYRLQRDIGKDTNFIDFFQSYIDSYTKKDIKVLSMSLRRFKSFLAETPAYRMYERSIKPDQITRDMVKDFTEYLEEHAKEKSEGARTIYARFKKVVKYAVEHDVMRKNPCTGIVIKVDDLQIRKEVLSQEEIVKLMDTHCTRENPETRRAFIFSLYTGLALCDVKKLTFEGVDFANRTVTYSRSKTDVQSVIPLNDGLLKLIGKPNSEDRNEQVFKLPSDTMCNKALAHWVKKAGINKHITWHCARHSFATNTTRNGANIVTVASLMGHRS